MLHDVVMDAKFTREERSWIAYDWANSAYSIIITTALFALFYQQLVTPERYVSTWGFTQGIGSIVVAILAPFLGTFADFRGYKKPLFTVFFLLGVASTASMVFLRGSAWYVAMAVYTASAIGFSGANVFYDSFLIDVTTRQRMHRVSANGFSWGYIGSVIPFVISLAIVWFWEAIGLPTLESAYRISFVITALWWGVFAIPLLRNVRQNHGVAPTAQPLHDTWTRFTATLKKIRSSYRPIFLFLTAYFFYIEGVNAIIRNATPIARDMGFDIALLTVVLLVLQIVAWPFALLYGWAAKRIGARPMIFVGIFTYVVVVAIAFFLPVIPQSIRNGMFWVLAMLIGSAQGGIQALSRSYFGRMIPADAATEFFGFYNIVGRFSSFIGSFLIALTTRVTGQSRYGVLSLLALFLIGGILLTRVPKDHSSVPA